MLALALVTGPVRAQGNGRPDSATVVPGPQYRAGGLKRTLFGADYRRLWTTPIRVPVLDLHRFAGGILPTEEGGGEQTLSLRFKNAAGREFQFRSVDKDAAGALPAELRETFIAGIVRDQTSSGHPTGALIVAPLLEAGGLLHAAPKLVQMPDDTVLGQFREQFAGILGTIEERPDSGFAGSLEVVSTEDLFERLNEDPRVRVHQTEFLAARLIDFLVGDWDRHRDQWRWARIDSLWRPIPRDRDQAFSRYDGWLVSMGRLVAPKLQNYGSDIPSLGGLTRNSIELERRLLSGLESVSFDSVARFLQERITDSVLAAAVRAMPAEFSPEHQQWLYGAMKGRRDDLKEAASRLYRRLAEVVEMTATDEAEIATIERESSGTTLVTVTSGNKTLFRRRFDPTETSEIRVRLRGGDDRVRIEKDEASRRAGPLVRVIGGEGNDRFEVPAPGGVRLYDDQGENQVIGKVRLDRKAWRWDVDSIWASSKPPDLGVRQRVLPTMGIARDVGVVFGFAGWIDWHRFRREPYATRLTWSGVYSTTRSSGRVTAELRRQLENSAVFFGVRGLGSGIESLRWYGFGNETVPEDSSVAHRVRHQEIRAGAFIGFRFGRGEASVGPIFRWASTPLAGFNASRFIGQDQPYGTGSLKMAGASGSIVIDTRDVPGFAREGFKLTIAGEAYPRGLDNDSAVARIESQASIAFAPIEIAKRRPSLHLRAGGIRTWGGLPYFLAATLGGQERLRGYSADRFAGDAALYGSAEVRLPLTRFKLLFPGEQGVFGFVDVGRVSVRNQPSDTWHHSLGAGVWLSFLKERQVVSLAVARPERKGEGNRLIVSFGFPY